LIADTAAELELDEDMDELLDENELLEYELLELLLDILELDEDDILLDDEDEYELELDDHELLELLDHELEDEDHDELLELLLEKLELDEEYDELDELRDDEE
jgi:hypothetical protein